MIRVVGMKGMLLCAEGGLLLCERGLLYWRGMLVRGGGHHRTKCKGGTVVVQVRGAVISVSMSIMLLSGMCVLSVSIL